MDKCSKSVIRRKPESRLLGHHLDPGLRRDRDARLFGLLTIPDALMQSLVPEINVD
jgi:hypothetical protein